MRTFSFRNFLNEEALDKALSPNVRSAIIDKGAKSLIRAASPSN